MWCHSGPSVGMKPSSEDEIYMRKALSLTLEQHHVKHV